MDIIFNMFQTFLGLAAGFFIAAPINKTDQFYGVVMIILSLVIGLI